MKSGSKIIISAVITLSLLIALMLLLFRTSSFGGITVEVIVVPTDSTLTIDGEVAQPGKITLSPGKHTLKATREHFGDVVKEIDTDTVDPSTPIYLMPHPDTPEAIEYLKNDPSEQQLRERGAGQEFTQTQQRLLQDYPILTNLPYQTIDYKIDYQVAESGDVQFTITLYPPNAITPGTTEYKTQLRSFVASALEYMEDNEVDTNTANINITPNPED